MQTRTILCVLAVGCTATLAGFQGKAQDASSQASNPAVTQPQQDKMFLRKASEGGYAEVQFGQLASRKAENPDVRAFGEKMVKDHTRLNDNMRPVAQQMGVMPVAALDKRDQAEYDRLSALSGAAFDREYVADMVADHRKDLREFRREESTAGNPQLKQTVADGEKVIAEHNRLAIHLAQEVGVPVPGRSNSTAQAPAR